MTPYQRVISGIKRLFGFTPQIGFPSPPHPRSAVSVKEEVQHVPLRIPRDEHTVSRRDIGKPALKVLYRLHDAGYDALLVGGGVRDLLLGRKPKDFDVVTNAKPDEVKALFRNCRLIGRRFRLAHVHFGQEIVEVATFRARHSALEEDEDDQLVMEKNGRILRDNVYGSFEEDAWRRDFTINSLYYNIADYSLVDYTHQGMADLRAGLIRVIGDPLQRYREDPVRMLRAVRFAAKLGFKLHPETEAPLPTLCELLADIPSSRLFEEINKLFLSGHALESFQGLRHYGLFEQLFPQTELCMEEPVELALVESGLKNTDRRVAENKPVNPAFLFAVLLWPPLARRAAHYQTVEGANPQQSLYEASHEIIRAQIARVSIPKRFSLVVHDIWTLQLRMERKGGRQPQRVAHHPRFRAAYDFLLLRAEHYPELRELADWWTRFSQAEPNEQENLIQQHKAGTPSSRSRRRRRRKKKPAHPEASSSPPSSE